MTVHELSDMLVTDVDMDLRNLGATCRLARKLLPRGVWETVLTRIPSFRDALKVAGSYSGACVEVAVFVEHEVYGGVLVWTSSEPDIANRFDGRD